MMVKTIKSLHMLVPTLAELTAEGKKPEVLFWVGCAGSFDERAKKITKSFVKILHKAGVSFAVLGTEESCTGDPAKRSGNEFLFQMQAMANIEVMNAYQVTRIVTTCPHCFNTLKNEYPSLGGKYQVMHHTTFINTLLKEENLAFPAPLIKESESPITTHAIWAAPIKFIKHREISFKNWTLSW